MTFEAQDLAYRARALAQAHPLSPLVGRYLKRAVHQEQSYQSLPDVGIWAGAALVDGYCLRRVEEEEPGARSTGLGPGIPSAGARMVNDAAGAAAPIAQSGLSLVAEDDAPVPLPLDFDPLDRLDEAASHIASDLRAGLSGGSPYLDNEERTVAALDLLVAGAVERRLDHLRDDVDEQAWVELGEYLTWWVVKGYALRVAEC